MWAGARIEAFEVVPFALRFREPYVTARGRLEERQLALLRLRAEGAEGLGEAAPLALRGSTPLALVVEELDAVWRPQLVGEQLSGDPEDHVRGVAEFSPQARDAVKMALFDLVGRLSDVPVWRLLGATAAAPVLCNATLPAADPGTVAENARAWAARGFETFKLKAGMEGDVAQVTAVRDAVGSQAQIRVDANGSWSVDVAVERLRQMAPLELAEQPVATLDEMAALRGRTDVRLAADESVVTAEDAEAAARVCDAATVKLAKVGGPRAAMGIAERIPVYLSSALDGPVGIAAAAHVVQAIDDSGFAHGLATSLLFADTVASHECVVEDGRLHLAPGPGLGVEIDEDALASRRIELG
ncbi:MAG: mandelate racemase/muconate lactonizing enzyme family protein [Solirubrobacterales bacterium]